MALAVVMLLRAVAVAVLLVAVAVVALLFLLLVAELGAVAVTASRLWPGIAPGSFPGPPLGLLGGLVGLRLTGSARLARGWLSHRLQCWSRCYRRC